MHFNLMEIPFYDFPYTVGYLFNLLEVTPKLFNFFP